MTITDIMLACDTIECGYRIVELEGGEGFAFVWGNSEWCVGDDIPAEGIEGSTDREGAEVYGTFEMALDAWRDCADALGDCGRTDYVAQLLALAAGADERTPEQRFLESLGRGDAE